MVIRYNNLSLKPDLKPETSFSWEVGLTTALFNEKTIISFDYYQSYIKDMMYNSEISTGVKKYMNAGKGEIKGFEAEIKQSISSFMDLNFNITKQKTKNTENSLISICRKSLLMCLICFII